MKLNKRLKEAINLINGKIIYLIRSDRVTRSIRVRNLDTEFKFNGRFR